MPALAPATCECLFCNSFMYHVNQPLTGYENYCFRRHAYFRLNIWDVVELRQASPQRIPSPYVQGVLDSMHTLDYTSIRPGGLRCLTLHSTVPLERPNLFSTIGLGDNTLHRRRHRVAYKSFVRFKQWLSNNSDIAIRDVHSIKGLEARLQSLTIRDAPCLRSVSYIAPDDDRQVPRIVSFRTCQK
jgi:hypothetical protein